MAYIERATSTLLNTTLYKKECIVKQLTNKTFHIGISIFKIIYPFTKKKPERCCCWRPSGVSTINFKQISHTVLLFLLLTLDKKMPAEHWHDVQWGKGSTVKTVRKLQRVTIVIIALFSAYFLHYLENQCMVSKNLHAHISL